MNAEIQDLIVLGGGPAGIEAIREAGRYGMSATIVMNGPAGGRAARGSLVPSKVWLAAAEEMDHARHPQALSTNRPGPTLDMNALKIRFKAQSEATIQWSREEVDKAGARLVTGTGILTGPGQVRVTTPEGEILNFRSRFVLIATGSEPSFRSDLKPDMERIIAPRLTPSLPEVPGSVIVAGGGVTGMEYAYAFAALGAQVTVLHRNVEILPRMDREVTSAFHRHLISSLPLEIHTGDGVRSMQRDGDRVKAVTDSGRTYEADFGFIATGRKPDLSWQDPSFTEVNTDASGFVITDAHAMTSVEGVYAAGDMTGEPMMANRALMQARSAVAHMLGNPDLHFLQHPVIEGVYTHPPVAQIGDMTPDIHARWINHSFGNLLKARIKDAESGLLRIKVDAESGLILGAAAFGLTAPDLLAPVQTAMLNDIPFDLLRLQVFAYPGFTELINR